MSSNLVEVATHTANIVVPDPGEDVTAASVIAGMQGLANRSARAHSFMKIVAVQDIGFTQEQGSENLSTEWLYFTGTTYAPAAGTAQSTLTFANVLVGDVFLCRFSGETAQSGTPSGTHYSTLRVHATDNVSGGGTEATISRGGAVVHGTGSSNLNTAGYAAAYGRHTAAAAGSTRIRILGKATASGYNWGLLGRWIFTVQHLRAANA